MLQKSATLTIFEEYLTIFEEYATNFLEEYDLWKNATFDKNATFYRRFDFV